jgi:hypothetical protein
MPAFVIKLVEAPVSITPQQSVLVPLHKRISNKIEIISASAGQMTFLHAVPDHLINNVLEFFPQGHKLAGTFTALVSLFCETIDLRIFPCLIHQFGKMTIGFRCLDDSLDHSKKSGPA